MLACADVNKQKQSKLQACWRLLCQQLLHACALPVNRTRVCKIVRMLMLMLFKRRC
jgi:hypothetical protein